MLNEGIPIQEICNCLLCKAEGILMYEKMRDREFGAPGVWNLLRCTQCGLMWLNPRPTVEDTDKVYSKYFTHVAPNSTPSNSLLSSLRKKIKEVVLAANFGYTSLQDSRKTQWFRKILGFISPLREMVGLSVMNLHATRMGKLLDVGCGSGRFLAWMKDLGWEVMGTKPDSEAVKVAREKFHIDVHHGTLEEARFPDESADVITLIHVIEHLSDPVNTLKECKRVLKNNGRIIVLTPNVNSLTHKVFEKAWIPLEPPRHFHLFSLHTVLICAERAGLKVFQMRTTARQANWIWSGSRFLRKKGLLSDTLSKKISWQWHLEGLAFQVLEYLLCLVKEVSEETFMVAGKEN